eukprot:TRINITY_DN458_c0_g1_i1.p1 TRINITY_DN458_c0_g1~~TRINITY_DN458_c0_g1_i1.p1  ORF type:complete len:219 (-),score=73.92 TRINITY_DN458_c0_g1_i1:704-1360(-)
MDIYEEGNAPESAQSAESASMQDAQAEAFKQALRENPELLGRILAAQLQASGQMGPGDDAQGGDGLGMGMMQQMMGARGQQAGPFGGPMDAMSMGMGGDPSSAFGEDATSAASATTTKKEKVKVEAVEDDDDEEVDEKEKPKESFGSIFWRKTKTVASKTGSALSFCGSWTKKICWYGGTSIIVGLVPVAMASMFDSARLAAESGGAQSMLPPTPETV